MNVPKEIRENKNALFEQRISKILPVYNEETGDVIPSSKGLDNIINSADNCAPYLARLMEKWPTIVEALSKKSRK